MADEQHIIEKVKVDVEVETVELAEKIKSEINDFIQKEVLTVVESYFAELNMPEELKNKVIQLNRVDLSLESASWNPNSIGFKQEIRDEVEKQMNPIISDLKDAVVRDELPTSQSFESIREKEARVYSKEERILRSMFHFLEFGTLPWWLNSVEESRELFSEGSILSALTKQPKFVQTRFEGLRKSPLIRERLVRQFPVPVIAEIIRLAWSSESAKRSEVTSFIREEIREVPDRLHDNVFQLLIDLSEAKALKELLNNRASERLFRQVHRSFFNAELNKNALASAVGTTHAVLRMVSVLQGRNMNLAKLETELKEVLKSELSFEIFEALNETKAFQKLSSSNSEEIKNDEEVSTMEGSSPIDKLEQIRSTEDEKVVSSLEHPTSQEKIEADSSMDVSKGSELIEESSHQEVEKTSEYDGDRNEFKDQTSEKEQVTESEVSSERLNDNYPEKEPLKNASMEHTSKIDEREAAGDSEDSSHRQEDKSNAESELNQETIKNSQGEEEASTSEVAKSEVSKPDKEPKVTANSSEESTDSPQSSNNVDQKETGEQDQIKSSKTESSDMNEMSSNKTNEPKNESEAQSISFQKKKTTAEQDLLSKIFQNESEVEGLKKLNTEKMPNELFVSNAGLVLLNPFIPTIFKKLELLGDDGKLLDPELAAVILHYSATGREGDYEFEMAFEKYLCGIPPSIPMNRKITLTEGQKEQVGILLSSVLDYWTALKSKSHELLQNEFLTRPGKLIVEKSNHRLIIERKTFDLFLDKLPWSYSLVKFSWKKELIFVEW